MTPLLAGLVLASYALWDTASRRQDERAALNVGVQYYFHGGGDDTMASQLILNAWQRRPVDSTLNLTRTCMCETVPLACNSLCSGGAPPSVYVKMQLTANDPKALTNPEVVDSRVVRVR
ncbi:MAG TPA: hypothetical protein PKX06_00695 [Phenylobacterium sp.]|nr:hypothetical protein [Phenylobacterium sp.]